MCDDKRSKKRKILACGIVCAISICIKWYNSIRERSNLSRKALLHPSMSPWARLLNFEDENSFLNLTGFNFLAFRNLSYEMKTMDERLEVRRRGRPYLLDTEGRLGITLFYLTSTMGLKHLALIFGVLPQSISGTIKETLHRIIRILKDNPTSKVQWVPFCWLLRQFLVRSRNLFPFEIGNR